jgi:hypothetical protein
MLKFNNECKMNKERGRFLGSISAPSWEKYSKTMVRAFLLDDLNYIKTKKIATNPQKHTASASTNKQSSQAFVQ